MTDTNQASEALKQKLSDTKTFNYNVYFGVDGGDYAISFDEALDEIVSIIRTEKLKLLAEIRERVVGKDDLPITIDRKYNQFAKNSRNALRDEQRIELTKLEAEL